MTSVSRQIRALLCEFSCRQGWCCSHAHGPRRNFRSQPAKGSFFQSGKHDYFVLLSPAIAPIIMVHILEISTVISCAFAAVTRNEAILLTSALMTIPKSPLRNPKRVIVAARVLRKIGQLRASLPRCLLSMKWTDNIERHIYKGRA